VPTTHVLTCQCDVMELSTVRTVALMNANAVCTAHSTVFVGGVAHW